MINNLDRFPIVIELPIHWGEMDAFQHVNNVIYFRYFESARIAYLEKMNYKKTAKALDIGIILASAEAKFIKPLFYPDTIRVGATVIDIKADRFVMDYAIYSLSKSQMAAVGSSVIVTYDYKKNSKVNIPNEFIDCIKRVQSCLIS